jgi:F0F1-type ATP synthase assembly protein I
MQMSGTMVLIVFCSLFGGIWIDRQLGTKPWLMLLSMVLGFALAMFSVIRIANDPRNR